MSMSMYMSMSMSMSMSLALCISVYLSPVSDFVCAALCAYLYLCICLSVAGFASHPVFAANRESFSDSETAPVLVSFCVARNAAAEEIIAVRLKKELAVERLESR